MKQDITLLGITHVFVDGGHLFSDWLAEDLSFRSTLVLKKAAFLM